jgi:hypothetical protein
VPLFVQRLAHPAPCWVQLRRTGGDGSSAGGLPTAWGPSATSTSRQRSEATGMPHVASGEWHRSNDAHLVWSEWQERPVLVARAHSWVASRHIHDGPPHCTCPHIVDGRRIRTTLSSRFERTGQQGPLRAKSVGEQRPRPAARRASPDGRQQVVQTEPAESWARVRARAGSVKMFPCRLTHAPSIPATSIGGAGSIWAACQRRSCFGPATCPLSSGSG